MPMSSIPRLTFVTWYVAVRQTKDEDIVIVARLLSAAIEALTTPNCAPPARDAVLDALESLLDSDDPAIAAAVLHHTGPVLDALKALVLRALVPGRAAPQASKVCALCDLIPCMLALRVTLLYLLPDHC